MPWKSPKQEVALLTSPAASFSFNRQSVLHDCNAKFGQRIRMTIFHGFCCLKRASIKKYTGQLDALWREPNTWSWLFQ